MYSVFDNVWVNHVKLFRKEEKKKGWREIEGRKEERKERRKEGRKEVKLKVLGMYLHCPSPFIGYFSVLV